MGQECGAGAPLHRHIDPDVLDATLAAQSETEMHGLSERGALLNEEMASEGFGCLFQEEPQAGNRPAA